MNELTVEERIDRYREQFTESRGWPPPQQDGEKMYGVWLIGNNYAAARGYYGEYPPTYLRRMYALFPETPRLHLFSGSYESTEEDEVTVDYDPHTPADVYMEVEDFIEERTKNIQSSELIPQFQTVFADPPYNREQAENYDAPYPRKQTIIKNLAPIIQPGGYLIWLDTSLPIWAKSDGWQWGGLISVFSGTNRVVRGAFILHRTQQG